MPILAMIQVFWSQNEDFYMKLRYPIAGLIV